MVPCVVAAGALDGLAVLTSGQPAATDLPLSAFVVGSICSRTSPRHGRAFGNQVTPEPDPPTREARTQDTPADSIH